MNRKVEPGASNYADREWIYPAGADHLLIIHTYSLSQRMAVPVIRICGVQVELIPVAVTISIDVFIIIIVFLSEEGSNPIVVILKCPPSVIKTPNLLTESLNKLINDHSLELKDFSTKNWFLL